MNSEYLIPGANKIKVDMSGEQDNTKRTEQSKPQKVSRMRLDNVVRGKVEAPVRVIVHGVDGVGKTTFGAGAPSPIFLGAEDGSSQLDVVRFPSPESWSDMIEAVRTLKNEAHDYRTLVVDSLDWAEPLVWRHLCEQEKVTSIEKVSGGYGKGYVAAVDEWRKMLAEMEALRAAKAMNIIFIAHSVIKTFKNPSGEDYERYQIKINDKAAGVLREWVDDVLFATYEVVVTKNEQTKRTKGVDTGARILHTVYSAAWDAKNRNGLPEQLPLSWDDYYAAVRQGHAKGAGALVAEIQAKALRLGGADCERVFAALERAGSDLSKLEQINNWITVRTNAAANVEAT